MKNPAAVALGRMAKGKAKTLTPEEIAIRTARLAEARKKRWAPKPTQTTQTTQTKKTK